jgi:hypothetical protein
VKQSEQACAGCSGDTITTAAPDETSCRHENFRVTVEEEARDLHPVVRDEIYKTTAEALRNAFRRRSAAGGGRDPLSRSGVRLHVRDDGKGSTQRFLRPAEGRATMGRTACRNAPSKVIAGKLKGRTERCRSPGRQFG